MPPDYYDFLEPTVLYGQGDIVLWVDEKQAQAPERARPSRMPVQGRDERRD